MEYESAQKTAERLHVTVRSVQKWAKDGKLPGAKQMGRTWMIPVTVTLPASTEPVQRPAPKKPAHLPMPLLAASFPPGQALQYIESISDPDERAVAMAEYYHCTGQMPLAVETSTPYLAHPDPALSLSAALVYTFCSAAQNQLRAAHIGIRQLQKHIETALTIRNNPIMQASAICTAAMIHYQFSVPRPATLPLEDIIGYLPHGLKLFACYLLANQAYADGDYERSLGIAQTALVFEHDSYPIASLYLLLQSSMNYVRLKQPALAREFFQKAYLLAKPDEFFAPIGELHRLLCGAPEGVLRKRFPEDYQRILSMAHSFHGGWLDLYNHHAPQSVADNLTPFEFAVAMLFSQNWRIKEIADYMELSERRVKHHLATIYEKLGISNRKELLGYILP